MKKLNYKLFSFFSMLSFIQGIERTVMNHRPPVLNIESIIDIPTGSNLTIKCEGMYPMKWLVPDNNESDTIQYESSDSTNLFNPNRKVYKYESTLTITEILYHETGFYTCCYNKSNCEIGENASSAYVFVNDPNNIFIKKIIFMPIHHGKKTVIPCRPTFSDSNVTFWKGYENEYVTTEDIVFDSRKGFIVDFPTIYFNDIFSCKTKFRNVEHKVSVHLIYFGETSPLDPFIEFNNNSFPVTDSSFSLNCSVKMDPGSIVCLEWNYPNKYSDRIEELEAYVEEIIQRNFKYKFVTTKLIINHAQLNDSGIYECKAIDHSGTKYIKHKRVQVYEQSAKPYLNLINNIDKSLERNKFDNVYFSINIQSFPYFEKIDLEWMKDGKPLPQDKRYEVTSTNSRASLKIKSLGIIDDGIYTLHATAGNITNSTSITLYILDKPNIRINGNEIFYLLNQNYELHCDTKGYPFPTVWWSWKQSNDPDNLNDTAEWTDVELSKDLPNVLNTTMLINGNVLEVVGNQSGYYCCKANNDIGESEKIIPFFVTDASNGFEIIISNENPVEKDELQIICKASTYHYKKVLWKWKDDNDYEIQLTSNISLGLEIISENTIYSKIEIVKFDSITFKNNGTYICNAIKKNSSVVESKIVHLEVRGIEKPSFRKTNMNESVVSIPATMHHEFFCYVEGVPFPKITWYKDGEIFDDSDMSGVQLTDNFQKLTINRVVEKDAGFYRCVAENKGGSISEEINLHVLKEEFFESQKMTTTEISVIIFVVILVLVLFFLAFMLIKKVYREKKEKKEMEFLSKVLFDKGQIEMFNPEMSLEEQVELLPYDHRWEFPKERLKLGKTLGQGAFGRVVKAEAIGIENGETSTTVAVKMLKERADVHQRKALMAELKILIHLGRHLNIVNLLGAVTKNVVKGELMIIVEYCCYGNLRHYLLQKQINFINQLDPLTDIVDPTINSLPGSPGSPGIENIERMAANYESAFSTGVINSNQRDQSIQYIQILHRQNSYQNESDSSGTMKTATTKVSESCSGDTSHNGIFTSDSECRYNSEIINQPVTTCDLLCFAFQAARGMEYLSSKKLIHRDLAARNVLLTEDNVVKICDFGLAKDCYKYSNYVKKGNGPLPIKWMAIESIRDKVFTCKSDVWSFGILLWEFFTLGGNPYPGIDIDEEFYKRLKNGYRMEKPEYAPKSIYNIMQDCWNPEPTERPTFTELAEKLGLLLEASVKKYYIELNMPYMVMNKELMNNNDYLQMGENGNSDYINVKYSSSENRNSIHYDDIGAIRPVGDGPVPTVPMEVVPMIQLEPINNNWSELKNTQNINSIKNSPPDLLTTTLPFDKSKSSDYLCMNSPKESEEDSLLKNGMFSFLKDEKNNIETQPPINTILI